jgi:hypothetical protein
MRGIADDNLDDGGAVVNAYPTCRAHDAATMVVNDLMAL